jgi:hypothetical protein
VLTKDSFWCGYLIAWLLQNFIEDLLGKERYITVVNASWVTIPWWPWAVGIAVALGFKAHFETREKQIFLTFKELADSAEDLVATLKKERVNDLGA